MRRIFHFVAKQKLIELTRKLILQIIQEFLPASFKRRMESFLVLSIVEI
jgi:hypothetical protein